MNTRLKVLLVGVGGQGVLTAARFLGEAAMRAGFPVMVGQLHGMSQRGGSVDCSVLIGPGHSSFIADGCADVVLGLEPLETLRARPKMSPTTRVVLNNGRIVPSHFTLQGVIYPPFEQIVEQITQTAATVFVVDGPTLLRPIGVGRSLNVLMLGALAGLGLLPFDGELLWQAVASKSPPRFHQVNRAAFDIGCKISGGLP